MHVSRHESIILEVTFRGLDGRLEDPSRPVEVYLRTPGGSLSKRRLARVSKGKYRHRESVREVGDYNWKIKTGGGYIEKGKPLTVYPDRNSILVIESLHHGHTLVETSILGPETQAYIDRVEADGGTVHDKDWVDTVITTLKDLGVYPDCVFLGDANMGTDAGSTGEGVGTLYDASGNEYDATQSDSAKKPTLGNDSIFGGKHVLVFDGTDDVMLVDLSAVEDTDAGAVMAGTNDEGSSESNPGVFASGNREPLSMWYSTGNSHMWGRRYYDDGSEDSFSNDLGASTPGLFVHHTDGADLVQRYNGSENERVSGQDSLKPWQVDQTIGSQARERWQGPLTPIIVFNATIAPSDLAALEDEINAYYSLY